MDRLSRVIAVRALTVGAGAIASSRGERDPLPWLMTTSAALLTFKVFVDALTAIDEQQPANAQRSALAAEFTTWRRRN